MTKETRANPEGFDPDRFADVVCEYMAVAERLEDSLRKYQRECKQPRLSGRAEGLSNGLLEQRRQLKDFVTMEGVPIDESTLPADWDGGVKTLKTG